MTRRPRAESGSRKGRRDRIPGPEDWRGDPSDFHQRRAHEVLFGKSADEARACFGGGRSIELAQALRYVPRAVFRYYVRAFAMHILSESARGDADGASSFLGLLADREEADPGSVREMYEDLAGAVDFVASHQERFDAESAIYGSFRDRGDALIALGRNKPRG